MTEIAERALPMAGRPARRPAPVVPWAERFLVFQIVCQVALLVPELGAVRVAVRMGAFGASLALLFLLPRRGWRHPAAGPAALVMAIVGLAFFHPTTSSLTAGAVQVALYLAILGPLFWVPRLRIDVAGLRRIILILWGFHSLSAAVGVLQVYFPGRFQPALSTTVSGIGADYVESLKIETTSGERVFRPMGLTDTPGGAATAGFYVVLLGTGLLLARGAAWFKGVCLATMILALICLYLSQVRATMVMAGICVVAFVGILAVRRQVVKSARLVILLGGVVMAGFFVAVSIGGRSVTDRLATLTDDNAGAVYYQNRGHFLEHTVTELLPRYPLGAGLARWGVTNLYFGSRGDLERAPIYAEIQWTGWLLDGGVPLILAYLATLAAAMRAAWVATRPRPGARAAEVSLWGALILAYGVGVLALTFSYPIFVSQAGMEFWLLCAALFTAARVEHAARAAAGAS